MTDEKVYSAKQVATRIGTDAKTLRKFFRSPASPFEAVGQGGRYEFPAKMLPDIEVAFKAWELGKGTTKASPKVNGTSTPKARGRRTRGPKIDREPGEHRALPMEPPYRRLPNGDICKRSEYNDRMAALGYADELGTPKKLIAAAEAAGEYVDPNVEKMSAKTKRTYLQELEARIAARKEVYGEDEEPTEEELDEIDDLEFDDEELELDDEDED